MKCKMKHTHFPESPNDCFAKFAQPTLERKTAHTPRLVLLMEYDGKFTVSYNLNDGASSAFRVIPEVGTLIVRAVNCHEELIQELKDLTQTIDNSHGVCGDDGCNLCGAYELAQKAIAKAEGR